MYYYQRKKLEFYLTGKKVNPVSKMMSHIACNVQNTNHAKKLVLFVKTTCFSSAYVARIGKNITTVSAFTVL